MLEGENTHREWSQKITTAAAAADDDNDDDDDGEMVY